MKYCLTTLMLLLLIMVSLSLAAQDKAAEEKKETGDFIKNPDKGRGVFKPDPAYIQIYAYPRTYLKMVKRPMLEKKAYNPLDDMKKIQQTSPQRVELPRMETEYKSTDKQPKPTATPMHSLPSDEGESLF
ncbi:MAG: hypothetical protein ACLFUS_00425 [Candidatus Sumerlaeia bacterium]